jgi:hypothetical protein
LAALLKLAKVNAALSGVLTTLCVAALTMLQVFAGVREGIWEPHRLSWLTEQLGVSQLTYKTASVTFNQWLPDVPLVAILAAAMLVHLLLYSFLVEFEKRLQP